VPILKIESVNIFIINIQHLVILNEVKIHFYQYKIGNRSALEWILDQYIEKKPTDPTKVEKCNTYHFADYKDQAIDLLKRV